MTADSDFLNILLSFTILLFLWIVLGTKGFKNANPVLTSALGSLTMGIVVIKLQHIGYLPSGSSE